MKKYLTLLALSGLVVFAADKAQTITGKGECAKCSLKETKECQMAVTAKDGTKYLVENNDVSKKFHKNICQDEKQVEVTGTVHEKDGKKVITAKEIKEVSKKS
jgi:RecG-like helicase